MKINQLINIFLIVLIISTSCLHEVETDLLPEKKETIATNGIDLSLFSNFSNEVISKIQGLRANPTPKGVSQFVFDPNPIMLPRGDVHMKVTATGTFNYGLRIRFVDFIDGAPALVEDVIYGDGVTGGSKNIVIPAYYYSEDDIRILLFEYYDEDTDLWQWNEIFQQPSVFLNIGFNSNIVDPIPVGGGNYLLMKTGTYPEASPDMIFFRAITGSGTVITDRLVITNPAQLTLPFTIPINEGASYRMVYLQYSLDYSEWITFETHIQVPQITYVQLTDWRVVNAANDPVNGYGGTAIISLSGTYDEIDVRIYGYDSYGNEMILREDVVKKGVFPSGIPNLPTGFDGAIAVQLPVYEDNGWSSNPLKRYQSYILHQWSVQAYINGEWKLLTSKDGYENTIPQTPFRIEISESLTEVSKSYTQWPFKIQGYWMNKSATQLVWIRIVTNPAQPLQSLLMEKRIAPHDYTQVAVDYTISVPDNLTGKSRLIYMIFSLDEGKTWNTWYPGWTLNGKGDGVLIQNG